LVALTYKIFSGCNISIKILGSKDIAKTSRDTENRAIKPNIIRSFLIRNFIAIFDLFKNG
jgi:hypothetical protein